jgi:hypothetical protein
MKRKKKGNKKKKVYRCGKTNFSAVSNYNHCPNGESIFGDDKNRKRDSEYLFILKA